MAIMFQVCSYANLPMLKMHLKNSASYLLQAWLHIGLSSSLSPINGTSCKAVPNTPSWPSTAQWQALNASISGQLLAPLPPAAVCDTSLSVFNNASCAYVASQYEVANFHSQDPISVMQPNFENDACLPSVKDGCNLQQFPKYVVNATEPAHVKAGVDFARVQNVRSIVKGTGYDYLGRSTAPNSLSIWTHNLRGLQWHDGFIPQGCSVDALPAITAAAGHRMFEIYDAAATHNSMIIGGEDPDVGLGGYITGGGHSPISAHYGLAADNILEFDVVTPEGDVVTLNQCTNTDFFFAFRGGGGSTFGVILSATFKTVPTPSMAWSHFDITQSSADTNTFWQATAYFHSQLPRLVKSGMMGYYNICASSPFNQSTPLILGGAVWILDSSIPAFEAIFAPFLDHINASFPVEVTHSTQLAPNVYDWWEVYYPPGAVAMSDGQLGSRLLDEKALSVPLPELAETLHTAYPDLVLLGNLVAGPGVWNAKPPGGLGSMTPAWRKAVVHLITPVIWNFFNDTVKAKETALLTNTYVAALRKLAPDSGCYLNEADVNEPDLPQAYWGDNYPRLLSIKHQYDPHGVFWCAPCVGSQDWTLKDGELCRA